MSRLENILDDCLLRLKSGEASVEECLAQYPEYAEELRRLFVTVRHLERGRSVRPTPIFKAQARAQLAAHMKARPRNRLGRWVTSLATFRILPGFGRAMNTALGLAAILFLTLTTGTVLAQRALPGGPLYEWKIATEEIAQAIYPDSLQIDLIVSERRNRDLKVVRSDPKASKVALEEYQEALNDLFTHTEPEAQKIISKALIQQRANLAEAEVSVPELEDLLDTLEKAEAPTLEVQEVDLQLDYQATNVRPGLITYEVMITNQGPASPVTATLSSALAPAETVVSMDQESCLVSEGRVTCTVAELAANRPQKLTFTTRIDACYSGTVVNTATLQGPEGLVNQNSQERVTARTDFTTSFPRPARVVYVQSNDRSHDLGLVASTADPLNYDLHLHAAAPAWSPDGSKLAFFGEEGISELGGVYTAGNGVWLMDMTSTAGQTPRLLLGQDHIKSLAWSPDGSKLAVEVGEPDLPRETIIINAENGEKLYHFAGEHPAWSPDSQQLVIKSCESGCGLWRVGLESDQREQITSDGTDSYPAWSLDGQYLAFSSLERAGNWEIYRLDWANGQITRLTNRPGTDTTPVFGPCSQEIYLRTDEYGSWWITSMRLDGSDEYKVQEGVGDTSDWGLARPAIR